MSRTSSSTEKPGNPREKYNSAILDVFLETARKNLSRDGSLPASVLLLKDGDVVEALTGFGLSGTIAKATAVDFQTGKRGVITKEALRPGGALEAMKALAHFRAEARQAEMAVFVAESWLLKRYLAPGENIPRAMEKLGKELDPNGSLEGHPEQGEAIFIVAFFKGNPFEARICRFVRQDGMIRFQEPQKVSAVEISNGTPVPDLANFTWH